MDKSDFKKAACRLFYDMINADGIIDDDEIVHLDMLKSKYGISDDDVINAHKITTSQAIAILKLWREDCESIKSKTNGGLYLATNIIVDLAEISGCDGDRDLNEAKLLSAVNLCLSDINATPIRYKESKLRFSKREIVYLNCEEDKFIEKQISDSRRYLGCLLAVYGYDFIFIPEIVRFLNSKLERKGNIVIDRLTPIIKFTNPLYLTKGEKAETFASAINNVTTAQFSKDFVHDAGLNDELGPSLLVKIKTSSLPDKDANGNPTFVKYSDFIAIPIETSVEAALQILPMMILSHTRNITSIVRRQLMEKLYCKGFHQTLIDYVVSHSETARSEKIVFKLSNKKNERGIDLNLPHVPFIELTQKEMSIYLLIIYLSSRHRNKAAGLPMRLSKSSESLFKSFYYQITAKDGDLGTGLSTQISNLRSKIDELSQLPGLIKDHYRISDDGTYYRVEINIKKVFIQPDISVDVIKPFEDWVKNLPKF